MNGTGAAGAQEEVAGNGGEEGVEAREKETVADEQKVEGKEAEEGGEEEEEVLLCGQAVELHGVCGELGGMNGSFGTVLEDYTGGGDGESGVKVRVNRAFFETREVRVPRGSLRAVGAADDGEDDVGVGVERKMGRVEVVWTYARRLNTGQHGGFGEVMGDAWAQDNDDESSVRTIRCTEVELHEFVSRMRFDRELDMGMLKRLGHCVRGFSVSASASDSKGDLVKGKGKDNVIATGLCARTSEVVGTAFFVRMHPRTGKLVDFSFDECMRTLMFVNDMENARKEHGVLFGDTAWETACKCFPYYDIGCKLTPTGFFGMRSMTRTADGGFDTEPTDMEAAESFASALRDGEEDDEDAGNDAALL